MNAMHFWAASVQFPPSSSLHNMHASIFHVLAICHVATTSYFHKFTTYYEFDMFYKIINNNKAIEKVKLEN